MTAEESQLSNLVARIVELRGGSLTISPAWIATESLNEIDPGNVAPPLVRLGCHLHLRQLARAHCRKRWGTHREDPNDIDQGELFEGLQWRYPTVRSKSQDEPEYILRDHMSRDDVDYNVARLRAEARAKLAHADALEAWGRSRAA